jgi:hypothetical protein
MDRRFPTPRYHRSLPHIRGSSLPCFELPVLRAENGLELILSDQNLLAYKYYILDKEGLKYLNLGKVKVILVLN